MLVLGIALHLEKRSIILVSFAADSAACWAFIGSFNAVPLSCREKLLEQSKTLVLCHLEWLDHLIIYALHMLYLERRVPMLMTKVPP